MLSVVEELKLEGCELNKSTPFTLTLKNTGKSPLSIRNVTTSCTCVKLSSEMQKRQKTLQPDVSMNVDFVFTPDVRGDVFREITFFSDAVNSMQTVRIWAVVE